MILTNPFLTENQRKLSGRFRDVVHIPVGIGRCRCRDLDHGIHIHPAGQASGGRIEAAPDQNIARGGESDRGLGSGTIHHVIELVDVEVNDIGHKKSSFSKSRPPLY